MTHLRFRIYDLRLAAFVAFVVFVSIFVQAAPKKRLPPIISIGADGHLTYDTDERGNRVPDFSTAGYAANEKEIPDAPIRVVISPIAGDETARIQKAIDYVGGLRADTNGIRGAILLLKGRHEIFGQLQITNSGIILRGEGEGTNGSILVAAGIDRRTLIRVFGQKNILSDTNPSSQITDDYVPVGATSFHVKDASGLKVGDKIFITRPSTKEWIDALGMREFGGGLGDWRLVWHPGSYDLIWDRVIQKIEGNLLTIDSPITMAVEKDFGGGFVKTYSWPGRIENIGIENLRLESAFDSQNPKDENHAWFGITMENTANSWVRQITFEHFAGSAVAIYETCKKISVEDCISLAPISENAGWRRNTFFTTGQQILFLRCSAENGRHDFSVGFCAAGPNAFVQCDAHLPTADSGAIQSWASGTLFDEVRIDGNALSLKNRGGNDEGAGWSAANSVLWNCIAAKIFCDSPPGAQNWAFGPWGEFFGDGVWRHANETVEPDSLFAAQLADRLGRTSATEILSDAKISTEIQNAKSVDEIEIPNPKSEILNPKLVISITNGWLVCDGKLLVGGVEPINWWRGNMRPSESKNYGVNLTRFAPGQIGAGFTDDLNAIADGMISKILPRSIITTDFGMTAAAKITSALGAWMAMFGSFYEQPFARSGTGVSPVSFISSNSIATYGQDARATTAWDGLSKYDLTKFNPWYWARLKKFADICAERGLVLFNENYFQHNILEDGAHWVDCPWRSQNNINDTGFIEPPFEVEKRIVMAPQFYDVTNPIRRKLHENYIRQNLNNFTNKPNVIQFTSAEFTGPLSFEQFWLDTIGDWKNETKFHPLIALAATKDVQDAILADEKRAAIVDVICFRYWWQTDRGLFAPRGGQNLSPRQFERQWKGGAPTDENLAAMTAEYRAKFPKKVIIASGEDERFHGAWAFLCAGGRMPDLPRGTNPKLLAAIPQMQPWKADDKNEIWALREPGKQLLIYSGNSGETQIDLSSETGTFAVQIVSENGAVTATGNSVEAGSIVTLKKPNARRTVFWLTKN